MSGAGTSSGGAEAHDRGIPARAAPRPVLSGTGGRRPGGFGVAAGGRAPDWPAFAGGIRAGRAHAGGQARSHSARGGATAGGRALRAARGVWRAPGGNTVFILERAPQRAMSKVSLLLITGSALLVAGLALSFYGSQAVLGELTTVTEILGPGESAQLSAELDRNVGETAVYVVQVMNPQDSQVSAHVTGPLGGVPDSGDVEGDSREVRFGIENSGTYTLTIRNDGQATEVAAALGHMPDTTAFSIGLTGFYIILVGLVAMAALAVYVVMQRKSRRSGPRP